MYTSGRDDAVEESLGGGKGLALVEGVARVVKPVSTNGETDAVALLL